MTDIKTDIEAINEKKLVSELMKNFENTLIRQEKFNKFRELAQSYIDEIKKEFGNTGKIHYKNKQQKEWKKWDF